MGCVPCFRETAGRSGTNRQIDAAGLSQTGRRGNPPGTLRRGARVKRSKPMNATRLQTDSGPLERYGTGPIHFAGSDSGLYERHLLFDNVVAAEYTSARDRFEAFARSGRDVLSQRWTLTQDTYARKDAKRIYYLSMEFLIGRSLANNVTNLLLGG